MMKKAADLQVGDVMEAAEDESPLTILEISREENTLSVRVAEDRSVLLIRPNADVFVRDPVKPH